MSIFPLIFSFLRERKERDRKINLKVYLNLSID